jgi:hypothetical protein
LIIDGIAFCVTFQEVFRPETKPLSLVIIGLVHQHDDANADLIRNLCCHFRRHGDGQVGAENGLEFKCPYRSTSIAYD